MREITYCILMPTYNNAGTLQQVITNVQQVCSDIIVVNDGSTDDTDTILSNISGVDVLSYTPNKGKGHALRKGFKRAMQRGFDYAITLDTDGQHEPHNIDDLISALKAEEQPVLLMGSRNMNQEGVPRKSSFGNRFSSFWFWAETGISLADTQTGFRAYPLKPIAKKRWYTNRFEFEIEIIVRLAWAGVPIKEVPVQVNYPEDRVSHFRPFTDFVRISILNTFLFTQAMLWQTPKRILLGKGEKSLLNRLKRELKRNADHPLKMGASVGTGLFFGIFPIWGFQMLVAFFVSRAFKLNSVVVLGVSNISIPPMIPFIVFASFLVGKPFVANGALLPDLHNINLETIGLQLAQYLIGATILAIAAGLIGFFLVWQSLLRVQKKGTA